MRAVRISYLDISFTQGSEGALERPTHARTAETLLGTRWAGVGASRRDLRRTDGHHRRVSVSKPRDATPEPGCGFTEESGPVCTEDALKFSEGAGAAVVVAFVCGTLVVLGDTPRKFVFSNPIWFAASKRTAIVNSMIPGLSIALEAITFPAYPWQVLKN